MAIVGLLLGTIGLDPMKGSPRFSFGLPDPVERDRTPPVAMGLFGISEVLMNLEKEAGGTGGLQNNLRGLFPSRKDWLASLGPIGRGTVAGFFLGILPGVGAIVPTFLSYAIEKRISKNPERFRQGSHRRGGRPGVREQCSLRGNVDPPCSPSGSLPTHMALLMGALMIHGLRPGPLLLQEHPDVFWGIITSMYTGNVMLLILNLPLIPLWVRVLKVPYYLLFPLIFLFCIIGIYSVNNNPMDIVVMGIFGAAGYLMRKFEYEPAPLVLAFVLGEKLEEVVRQALIYSRGDFGIFFRKPIAASFLIIAIVLLLWSVYSALFKKTSAPGEAKTGKG